MTVSKTPSNSTNTSVNNKPPKQTQTSSKNATSAKKTSNASQSNPANDLGKAAKAVANEASKTIKGVVQNVSKTADAWIPSSRAGQENYGKLLSNANNAIQKVSANASDVLNDINPFKEGGSKPKPATKNSHQSDVFEESKPQGGSQGAKNSTGQKTQDDKVPTNTRLFVGGSGQELPDGSWQTNLSFSSDPNKPSLTFSTIEKPDNVTSSVPEDHLKRNPPANVLHEFSRSERTKLK